MDAQVCNDKDTEVAPLIQNFLGNGDTFKRLQEIQEADDEVTNHFNYILRCTDGMFKGKFLYINTTPDGESFGSGDPDEYDLTMYIETPCLSPRHAEIYFENNKYLLKDCESENGTWLRIGHPCDEFGPGMQGPYMGDLDLYQESRLRTFKAGEHVF